MTVPNWVQDSVFYQIFPDRFANGDTRTDPVNVQPWDALPTVRGFQGGDLRGIVQKLDYLLDLGINAIYLNPIFQSPSTHRYNTTDYFKIDSKLGDLEDFHALIEVAHRNDIHIILDGVFNHCGRGFFAFNDLLENQDQSPYCDWFVVNHFPIDAYNPGDAQDYVAWWKFKSLPKFNTKNPQVRRYIMDTARYWIEQGADGWRLDVPNEIDDDSFWAEFRETVLSVNRDAYLLGEIWDADPRWVNNTHFDGLMNYPVRDAALRFINGVITASQFADKVEKAARIYPHENIYAMYNLLGSHDTERIWTLFAGEKRKVQLAFLFQFAYPGVPVVYYGDEIGLPGGRDPDCRRTFPWDQDCWNVELRAFVQQLISLRRRIPAIRRGDFRRLLADDARACYAFSRGLGDEKVVVVLNASPTRRVLRLQVSDLGWKDGLTVHNLVGEGNYIVSGDTLSISLSPISGVWIK
jgi:cyclomaltodextrinase